jgi:superfamily II DNA or RNA helicase
MYNIKAKHTSIVVSNYNLGDKPFLEKMLSVWNDSTFSYDTKGFMFNEKNKQLLIPRGMDLTFLEKTFNTGYDVDYKPDDYDAASIRLLTEPRNDIQRKSISFLLGENDFAYTKKYSQLTLNLDTGDGKTYCVIAALSFIKVKTMIITHINKIKDQWYNSLLKMTDIQDSQICNIEGSQIIDKLLTKNDWKFKIYLVNHQTIQNYANKNGWGKITELFQKIKIGLKVFDESHLNFENLLKIDLNTNTKKTFYLTANFERSDYKENKLFNLCFKNIAKFGTTTRNEKRKHIVYLGILYNSKPSLDIQAKMIGRHGFDRNKYIDYQVKTDIFFNVLKYIINYFKDKEGKTLIFSSKIESSKIIYNWLINTFPNKISSIYNSEIPENEKEKSLNSEYISSTLKSSGTGVDIPQLRFVINTEPYSSKVTGNQASGRLREYSPEEYTFYIETVDIGFPRVYDMYKGRRKIWKEKCAKMLELKYTE